MMKKTLFILMIILASTIATYAQEIIPHPNHYESQMGVVDLPRNITISANAEFSKLIPDFVETAQKFSIHTERKKKNGFIRLAKNVELDKPEEYRIRIASTGILIEAGSFNGCFYGLQEVMKFISAINSGMICRRSALS